jgi:SAM-dependent methyltransferase
LWYFFGVTVQACHAPPGDHAWCPLCEALRETRLLEEIPYRTIFQALAVEWGAEVPALVARRHMPAETCRLLECSACGFRFFPGAMAGDGEFYASLSATPAYYARSRWEFGWVKRRLIPGGTVLDAGCGPGVFLSEISLVASRAVGLEMNPSAIEAARRKGLEVYPEELEVFSRENAGKFDAACAFHLLEHVEAPAAFLRSLVRCVRPGGKIFLSVPNRDRSAKSPLEPLDCPPHHLSRWGAEQMRRIGGSAGLRLRELAFEPVDISVPAARIRDAVARAIGKIPVAGKFLGDPAGKVAWRVVLAPPLWNLYRNSGILERKGFFGLSVAASYNIVGA